MQNNRTSHRKGRDTEYSATWTRGDSDRKQTRLNRAQSAILEEKDIRGGRFHPELSEPGCVQHQQSRPGGAGGGGGGRRPVQRSNSKSRLQQQNSHLNTGLSNAQRHRHHQQQLHHQQLQQLQVGEDNPPPPPPQDYDLPPPERLHLERKRSRSRSKSGTRSREQQPHPTLQHHHQQQQHSGKQQASRQASLGDRQIVSPSNGGGRNDPNKDGGNNTGKANTGKRKREEREQALLTGGGRRESRRGKKSGGGPSSLSSQQQPLDFDAINRVLEHQHQQDQEAQDQPNHLRGGDDYLFCSPPPPPLPPHSQHRFEPPPPLPPPPGSCGDRFSPPPPPLPARTDQQSHQQKRGGSRRQQSRSKFDSIPVHSTGVGRRKGRAGEIEVHRYFDSSLPSHSDIHQLRNFTSPPQEALQSRTTQRGRPTNGDELGGAGELTASSMQHQQNHFLGDESQPDQAGQTALHTQYAQLDFRSSDGRLRRGSVSGISMSPGSCLSPLAVSPPYLSPPPTGPCLASPKVQRGRSIKERPEFRRNGSQPCLRTPAFNRQNSALSEQGFLNSSSVRSFSEECLDGLESRQAMEVVRTKRAKQQLADKGGKYPSRLPDVPSSPALSLIPPPGHLPLSPTLPPPPSPPCTCGKVLTDMGPPPEGGSQGDQGASQHPPLWDTASLDSRFTVESKGTLESRRSQGYVSMTSASTYLIDATGADPVLVVASQGGPPTGDNVVGYHPAGGAGGGVVGGTGGPRGIMSSQAGNVGAGLAADDFYCDEDTPLRHAPPLHREHHFPPPPLSSHGPGPGGDVGPNGRLLGGGFAAKGGYPTPGGGVRIGHCNHLSDGCECFRPEEFSFSRKPKLERFSNGNCSNGFLKDISIEPGLPGERGITFRVGKFIGQVTIENVKFRRQHWLFLFACILVFIIILSVYLPIVTRGPDLQNPEYRMGVVRQLLREVPLVDGHNDLPWNIRKFVHGKLSSVNFSADLRDVEPWSTSKWSHTDIPRLKEGGLGAQLWVAYAPCGSQHKDAVQITLEQIDLIKRFIEQYQDTLEFVTSSQELVSAHNRGRIASLISVESGHSIGTSLGVLRMYQRLGVRSLALTHNCNNPWADSSQVDKTDGKPLHNGLTDFGKSVVKEMNRLGIIVDLSHSSIQTSLDALETSEAPVIFSHSSAHQICNSTRNVPDNVLKKLTAKGGIVMINFFSYFITCSNASAMSDVVDHITHVRNVAGIDAVGIGASYDGINAVPTGLEDVSKYVELFSTLYSTGNWSVDDLKKLAGLNFLRVFREVEKVGQRLASTLAKEELIPGEDIRDSIECRTINKRNANATPC